MRQDETVTAVYTPVPYTITYELGEGTNPLSNVEEYTVETALRLEAPSKQAMILRAGIQMQSIVSR